MKTTENKHDLYPIVGKSEIEPEDITLYAGHYTIEGLSLLVAELKKHYKDNELVAIQSVFSPTMNAYALVVVPDDDFVGKKMEGIGLQGCEHGVNGRE